MLHDVLLIWETPHPRVAMAVMRLIRRLRLSRDPAGLACLLTGGHPITVAGAREADGSVAFDHPALTRRLQWR